MKLLLLSNLDGTMLGGCGALPPQKRSLPENALLIDVRSAEEFNAGHLDGAVNLPYDTIAAKISGVAPDKAQPLFLYCRSGRRVAIAMESLTKAGYTDLHNLGGFEEAKKQLEP